MKKISVLILSNDVVYNRNVGFYFRRKYSDEIRIAFCDSPENLIDNIRNNNVKLLIVDEMFADSLPEQVDKLCIVGYFSGMSGHTLQNNTFCKYISGTDLYKNIIFLCSQGVSDFFDESGSDATPVYTFVSVNGNGSTTLSMAFAERKALDGKKVLFIGLDGFTDYASLFAAHSDKGLSDIIYAVKSKSSNVRMVAKSVASKADNGVYFIDSCRLCDDLFELSKDETDEMLDRIIFSGEYDIVVLDINFFFHDFWNYAAKKSTMIFIVSENTEAAISKGNNFINNITARDLRNDTSVADRLLFVLNKSRTSVPCRDVKCERITNISGYPANNFSELVSKISRDNGWDTVE